MIIPSWLGGVRLTGTQRLGMVVICVGLLAMLLVAAGLSPDGRGFGTHEQLGLPPCGIQTWFGRPCPGCGMTTSLAHYVRGEWVESARVNPAGLLWGWLSSLMVVWGLASAWSGVAMGIHRLDVVAAVALGLEAVVAVLVWLVRWM